jgi:hypothetical protein
MSSLNKTLDTPESFFDSVPKNLVENIEYRINLHSKLVSDKEMQKVFLELCWADKRIMFDTCFWTYNPRKETGKRNIPFILRPQQEKVITTLDECIRTGFSCGIEKSREEGATELICKLFAAYWLMSPEFQALVGSRKAEFVDKGVEIVNGKVVGLHKTLMHKICYAIVNLPEWMKPKLIKTYMMLQNMDNDSVISGEATNENFGAGDRQTAILVDEHGRMDYNMADSIIDSIKDTSDCIIYNSTHWYGTDHPFNRLLRQQYGDIKVIKLPWWQNPEKNFGLYRSPAYDTLEIKDVDFYRGYFPEAFKNIEPMTPFKLSELMDENEKLRGEEYVEALRELKLVADGGDSNDGGWRSHWYDITTAKRSVRDVASNLDMRPRGSGSSAFRPSTLHRVEQDFVCKAKYTGDIRVVRDHRTLKVRSGVFIPDVRAKLFWWGNLIDGRPDQTHNFIVACDIGLGMGASNSVAEIIDVNLCEQVGEWVDANTPPESFGDLAVALCYWIGGLNKPYLSWEANGPGGVFEKSILKNGYDFVYIQRDEKAKHKKKRNRRGWINTGGPDGSKARVCYELDAALSEGLNKEKFHKWIIVHSEPLIRELETYQIAVNGTPKPTKSMEDEDSGGDATHGDRVVALAIAVLMLEYQPKAVFIEQKKCPKNSLGARIDERKKEALKEKLNARFRY